MARVPPKYAADAAVAGSRRGRLSSPDDAVVGAALLAGPANVIMQLADPGVGYGVVESTVESGRLFSHPVKRARTTLTYLAVAQLGTDDDKQHYRRAVNRAHSAVRSGQRSPVEYNAFDVDLQLWVAACLYKGFEDTCDILLGPCTDAELDEIYARSATFGTTLQVPRDAWPADRQAFQKYWDARLRDRIHIDDTVRNYLHDMVDLRFLPAWVGKPLAPLNRFVTTGFLPQRFREEMRLPWSPLQQRRFERSMTVLGAIVRRTPKPLRQFPFNTALVDLRRRVARGRRLV